MSNDGEFTETKVQAAEVGGAEHRRGSEGAVEDSARRDVLQTVGVQMRIDCREKRVLGKWKTH